MSQNDLPDTLTPSFSTLEADENLPALWGRLIPRRRFLQSIDLRKPKYLLGRKDNCDIIINGTTVEPNKINMFSKEHFMISRDITLVPYIKDLSKNGTYLNDILIGLNKTLALFDGDIISVGYTAYEMYQFKDDETISVSEDFDKKYRIKKLIGKGSFGEVYLATSKRTNQRCAIKKIKFEERQRKKINNEIRILECLKHPSVIEMKEALYGLRNHVFIILEYMAGGDLQSRVLTHHHLSEGISKLYIYQIALAVRYLHNCSITHRDLKPENVLLATGAQITKVKVTDFGMSKIVGESNMMSSLCGTPLYVAPDILTTDNRYTPLVDVWSLGCIAYFTLYGRTPFQVDNDGDNNDGLIELYTRIKRGQFTIPNEKYNISKWAIQLISKMLVVESKKRIKIEDVIEHDWFLSDTAMLNTVTELLSNEQ